MNLTGNPIVLPGSAAHGIASEVRAYGARDVETGGFLLASGGLDVVTVVALAGRTGVLRRRDLLQVSERAVDRLFEYADQRGLWIPAHFHSHGGPAFLSPTDRRHGLAVEGFTTTVLPSYSAAPSDPAKWGWWRFESGEWRPIAPPAAPDAASEFVWFDADGVRAA